MSILNQIAVQFNAIISGWQSIGIGFAKEIFVVLAIIQLIWSTILWMLNKNNPDEALIEFIRKMLFLSLFWQVLTNYNSWVPAITNFFRDVGSKISGTTTIYPADIFDKGIHLASLIFQHSDGFGFGENILASLTALFVGGIVFLAFTRIAIEMILILIGSKLILIGGIIMLGFAGNQWTYKYAERYFATAINFGAKMLFISLIIGLGEALSDSWADLIQNATSDNILNAYFSVLGAVLTYAYLSIRIPDMAATMLTGEALSIGFPGAISSGIQAARNTVTTGQASVKGLQNAGTNIKSGLKAGTSTVKKTIGYFGSKFSSSENKSTSTESSKE